MSVQDHRAVKDGRIILAPAEQSHSDFLSNELNYPITPMGFHEVPTTGYGWCE
jgi:hypothetical protein